VSGVLICAIASSNLLIVACAFAKPCSRFIMRRVRSSKLMGVTTVDMEQRINRSSNSSSSSSSRQGGTFFSWVSFFLYVCCSLVHPAKNVLLFHQIGTQRGYVHPYKAKDGSEGECCDPVRACVTIGGYTE
jgi:hypothetical protein